MFTINYSLSNHNRDQTLLFFNNSNHTECLFPLKRYEHIKTGDFSNDSYVPNARPTTEKSFYEISIKLTLCLTSIFASLFGNLLVLYSIFILPKLRKKFHTSTTTEVNAFNQTQFPIHNLTSSNTLLNKINNNNNNCSKKTTFKQPPNNTATPPLVADKAGTVSNTNNFTSQNLLILKSNQSKTSICNGSNSKSLLQKIEKSSIQYNNQKNNTNQQKSYSFMGIKKRRDNATKLPYYRKTVNLFILNLSICDLMIVFWCSWVHMVNSITDRWLLGAIFCRFNTFVQILSLIAAISTLSVISFERFTGIVCSMNNKLNRKKTIIIIIFIWIFSTIAATPALLYRKQFKRVWRNRVESWCSDDWPKSYNITIVNGVECIIAIHEPLRQIYYTFISCVLFFIPIIIMSICYCLIILKLWGTKIPGENCYEKQLLLKRRKKVAVILIWLLLSFTICWSPAQFLILHEAHRDPYQEQMPYWFNWVYFLVYLLAYSNSAINPIMYAGLNRHYRKAFRIRC